MAGGKLYPTGWLNGRQVPADDVRLPMFCPGVAFAAAVYEGIRGYVAADGDGFRWIPESGQLRG